MEYPHLHPSWHKVRDISKEEYEELRPKCFTISYEGLLQPIKGVSEQTEKEVLKYMLVNNLIYTK